MIGGEYGFHMKRYRHLTELDAQNALALKALKAQTRIGINRLLNLCVDRALPLIAADLKRRSSLTHADWSDFCAKRRRKVSGGSVDEMREEDRRA